MNILDSLQRIVQDFATPIVTIQRRMDMGGIWMTIAWNNCIFTKDISAVYQDAQRKGEFARDEIDRIVSFAIQGLADAIKGGTCAHCGSRKELAAQCGRCGA